MLHVSRRPFVLALILLAMLIIILSSFATTVKAASPLVAGSTNNNVEVVKLIKQFEGFSHTPYKDISGYSIGYGHHILPGENLKYVTREQAEKLLAKDLAKYSKCVDEAITVEMSLKQRAAMISLCYNIGTGGFKQSTLARKVNSGKKFNIAAEFGKYIYAGGKINKTLVARRKTEAKYYES